MIEELVIHLQQNHSVLFWLCTIIPILLILINLYRKPKIKFNNRERIPGDWKPEDYKFPIPPAYPEWDIHSTDPIPYRAFKHKYNITMGVRTLHPHEWVQIDNEWPKYHDLKIQRMQEKGNDLYGTADSRARAAGIELLTEYREYLPARYPKLFVKTRHGLKNLYTGEVFEFLQSSYKGDPMYIIGHLTQDDIAILTEDSKGEYYFTAGSILLAGSWRFKDKFQKSLDDIHKLSKVPKYLPNLQKSMMKFFYRMSVDSMVVRFNYSFQMDNNLPWAFTSLGDEDNDETFRFSAENLNIKITDIYYRSERQSLRRLPKTGAIVFGIRTYFIPLVEICKEPHVPKRLLNGVNGWDEESKEYKGFTKFKDIVMPYLEEKAKEQEEMGYTVENEVTNYPF